ncbi:hypothetical protein DICSQDRAFT_132554 [Dichomitus squalens LYAD-421 SS1]|uniref:uncharacterized protein n=1 Tax=Dichomitus squalens (strain LYAD-421) TaxID=732165 RepID=UPI00044135D7|nr:uncharacterized protein DICSQDRAFT_132554 [Dichomitus squalens LYAD-421 SS1]EJF65031.1 hypothetical protein DICSQDRAFT_132554 [Dichomitus squalens LYAD-421 SS1]
MDGARSPPCFANTSAICAKQMAFRYLCVTVEFRSLSTTSLDEPTQRRCDSSSQSRPSYE